jgi:hypothetical protein
VSLACFVLFGRSLTELLHHHLCVDNIHTSQIILTHQNTTQHKKTKKYSKTTYHLQPKKIMPKTATKRKKGNGKSVEEEPSPPCRNRSSSGTVAAEFPVVTLVVTPEAASHARVLTPLSIETSPPTLSSQLLSQSSNLSTTFYAESSACIKKSTSSVVRKKAEYIDFCDSAQVKSECLKYTKTAAEVPIDQQTQISFLLRKFNTSAITSAFSMLIGKVAGAAPMAFFHCHQRKKI